MDVALNWIAQGMVVALAAAVGLRVIPLARTQAREGLVWTAYLLVLALPAMSPLLATVSAGPTDAVAPAAAGPIVTMPETWWTSPAVWIALWLIWSGVQTGRFAVGARAVRDARWHGLVCPADVLARLPHWSRVGAGGRRARVILSSRVRAAAVLGGGTPIIALAPRLVEQLEPADLDRVLVHEWAHVQRRDDVAQLAQRVLHLLFGWHPAVWWLDRQLESEREAACDAIVVTVTGSARDYATCLAGLASLPDAPLRAKPALAAARSRLGARVARLLAAPGVRAARPRRAVVFCASVGLVACAVGVGRVSLVATGGTSAVASIAASPLGARPVAADMRPAVRSAETVDPGPRPVTAGRPGVRRPPTVAVSAPPPRPGEPLPVAGPSGSGAASAPLEASTWPVEAPGAQVPVAASLPTPIDVAGTRPAEQAPGVWTQAADVGRGIGRVSERSGTTTAGVFSRFGKKIAGAF